MSIVSKGLCLRVDLGRRNNGRFPEPQKLVHSIKHSNLLYPLSTRKVIKIINYNHRKNKIYSTGDQAFSSHVGASISISKHYEKDDGIVIVDHGSRRAQSNSMLHEFVEMFKQKTGYVNVEPAHMELACPTIKEAFDECVCRGASRVIITPYFLFPGRHWDKDIPALAAEAAKEHPHISYIVTAPIGLHALMVDILQDRINYCLSQVAGKASECEMCEGTGRCKVLQSLSLSE